MDKSASARKTYTVELLIPNPNELTAIDNEITVYDIFKKRGWKLQKGKQRKDGSVYIWFTTTDINGVNLWVAEQMFKGGCTVEELRPKPSEMLKVSIEETKRQLKELGELIDSRSPEEWRELFEQREIIKKALKEIGVKVHE